MKKTKLRKVSAKKLAQKDKEVEQLEQDRTFYQAIWLKRPHICQICCNHLGSEPKTYNFDHLLEKSKYPQLRYVEANVILICLEDHGCKTDGHPRAEHQRLIDKAKKELLENTAIH